jgi:hypothetical protein
MSVNQTTSELIKRGQTQELLYKVESYIGKLSSGCLSKPTSLNNRASTRHTKIHKKSEGLTAGKTLYNPLVIYAGSTYSKFKFLETSYA